MASTLPSQLHYRMPAEWEPHEATWVAWPHQREDWPGKFSPIPWVYGEIVRSLAPSEIVRILVNDAEGKSQSLQILEKAHADLSRVEFFEFPTDRVWTRDSGPIFVVRDHNGTREVALTHWTFNAWSKYQNFHNDRRLPALIGDALGLPVFKVWRNEVAVPVVLEGGSIDVNGQGYLLTTEECLLSPIQMRNPGLTREYYESLFLDYLGVRKVIWLGRGIEGDDTHGHVDDLTRFVAPNKVVTVVTSNTDDPNYQPLQENLERLRTVVDAEGRRLEIVTLPMPDPLFFDGQRLPASYANFYIANRCVLVPTFNDPHDRLALGILADLFPDRKVIGIHAVDLVWGFGTLHCLTQQQPAGGSVGA